ncbi:MAG: tRNA (adenosine(37)-N6)-threonylcarbamoyltransferase complex transferase subunit TsaD [Gammaproteobacteria bacterium]|nr:tRNA (adenosine(37)-N6)-threonylcarbamoyltransferase complex transferase subunit TsaD [Gammaproteobacteria bacterium]
MKVLGIESSCDETGVAIINEKGEILSERLFSQVDLHAEYGGVVPELASRDHIRKISPLLKETLYEANLSINELDAIAYTAGPGLVGALFVGASVGRSIAWSLGLPSIPVHHMEAHLLVPFLNQETGLQFPFLCLLVSGGHTMIVQANSLGKYQVLGESRDDAVGEAFDKVAKQLSLGYPGGPAIERLAKASLSKRDNFPRPMIDNPSLDFSFSGLKTHTLLEFKKSQQTEEDKADIAHAFQQAVTETLFIKCQRAIQQTGLQTLVVAGGVSANRELRTKFNQMGDVDVIFPGMKVCTDNGVMIAYTGLQYALEGKFGDTNEIKVFPRWSLQSKNKH